MHRKQLTRLNKPLTLALIFHLAGGPCGDTGLCGLQGGLRAVDPQAASAGQVRSGQVYYSAEVRGHESHKAASAASAASEVSTGLYLAALE